MLKFGLGASGVQAMKYPLIAKKGEEAGFESFWMPEHLIMPTEVPNKYPYTPGMVPPINSKTQMYDPWVTLGWVAAVTEKINLATGVFILPLRHPIYTARQVATLDMISQGRVQLGVGAGWQPDEFDYVDLGWRGPRAAHGGMHRGAAEAVDPASHRTSRQVLRLRPLHLRAEADPARRPADNHRGQQRDRPAPRRPLWGRVAGPQSHPRGKTGTWSPRSTPTVTSSGGTTSPSSSLPA